MGREGEGKKKPTNSLIIIILIGVRYTVYVRSRSRCRKFRWVTTRGWLKKKKRKVREKRRASIFFFFFSFLPVAKKSLEERKYFFFLFFFSSRHSVKIRTNVAQLLLTRRWSLDAYKKHSAFQFSNEITFNNKTLVERFSIEIIFSLRRRHSRRSPQRRHWRCFTGPWNIPFY